VYAATSEGAVGAPRSGWLRTWDVANPRQIRELGKVPLAGVGRFVRLVGEELVVLSDTRLEVFDANDPIGLPKIHSAPALAEAVEADLVGDRAWLGAGVAGLRAVPLAGTGSAEGERLLNLPGRAETLALDGEILYVEDADRRILVYRADEVPAGPIGELAEAVQAGAMAASGGYLYLGTQDRQLKIYDVRDVGRMQQVGSLSLPQTIARIAVTGGHAYLATDPFLRAVNVRDPAHPQVVSQVQLTGGVTDLATEGAWLYAVGPNMGARPQPSLKSVDISEPRAPEERALVPALGSFGGLAVADRLVYVSGLQIVDVCDPVAPVELSRLTTPGRPHDVAVDGWRVYLAKHGPLINGELQLVDARFPRRPVLAASQAPADAVDDVVARDGGYWAAARESGLLIGRSPDVYFPTRTPDLRPTATRPPGLDLTTYLPLVRFDRYVRPCPAP
jgi:hypothetical protein